MTQGDVKETVSFEVSSFLIVSDADKYLYLLTGEGKYDSDSTSQCLSTSGQHIGCHAFSNAFEAAAVVSRIDRNLRVKVGEAFTCKGCHWETSADNSSTFESNDSNEL
jgi:hypothetical protein